MKKLMMIALLATMTVAASAQDKERKTAEQRAADQTARMTKELGLSQEQAAKVEAINLDFAKQAEVLRAQREAEREAMRKEGKGKAIREEHDAKMKAVLTAEQYTTWQAKKEAVREKHMEKRKSMREQN